MHSLSVCRSLFFNFSDVSSIISEVTLGKFSDVRASNLHHAGLFAVSKASDVTINLFLFRLYVRLLWVFLWQVAWMAVLSFQACTFWFAEIYTDKFLRHKICSHLINASSKGRIKEGLGLQKRTGYIALWGVVTVRDKGSLMIRCCSGDLDDLFPHWNSNPNFCIYT